MNITASISTASFRAEKQRLDDFSDRAPYSNHQLIQRHRVREEHRSRDLTEWGTGNRAGANSGAKTNLYKKVLNQSSSVKVK